MKFRTLCLAAIGLGIASCGKPTIVDQKFDINPNGWTYADSLKLNFNVVDTLKIYNIYLTVVHQKTYGFQNLYARIATQFPNGVRVEQPLSLELYEPTGKPVGKPSSETIETEILARENAYFDNKGNYQISIGQFMRTDSLRGVSQIRFRVQETGETRKK